MKTYFIYKETFFVKLYLYFFRSKEDKVLYWDRDSNHINNYLPLPSNGNFYILLKDSRAHLEKYYSRALVSCSDIFLVSYFKKVISYKFADYYYFMNSVEKNIIQSKVSNYKIFSEHFLKDIYNNKDNSHKTYLILLDLVFSFIAILKIFKKIILCYLTTNKTRISDLFFYRKKILPDPLNIKKYIFNKYRNKFTVEVGTLRFSRYPNKYGIVFLNQFKNSFRNSILSFLQTIKYSINDYKFFRILDLPAKYFSSYLHDTFDILLLVNLNFKAFSGILEKPPFILLNRYKKPSQIICSFGDSFIFKPAVHLDYVFADHFYAWNEIDLSYINKNGGEFGESMIVGNIRSNYSPVSNGLSDEMVKKMNSYDKVVLVTTTQIHEMDKTYYPFTIENLNLFINSINNIARQKKKILFIIKYKKGEYKLLDKDIYENSEELLNIYPVYSDIPTKLMYNQFEDILIKSNLVISMCNWSTTIWQALSQQIPVLACNDDLGYSFLKNFNYLEVKYSELEYGINYWMKLNENKINEFFEKIGSFTNLFENGFESYMDDVAKLITKERVVRN